METTNQNQWDALSESAKAFANTILGEYQTDLLRDDILAYPQLLEENKQLKAEAASLKENLPFRDKYENLQKEFRKVTAERDSLSSQALEFTRMSSDYEKMKRAYREMKGNLAAVQSQLDSIKHPMTDQDLLEALYQSFKRMCDGYGVDIRRIPANLYLQLQLQDSKGTAISLAFNRKSKDKWSIIH